MKDILIIGGFNWLGFEFTKMFIEKNQFSNIIIVDIFKNFLLKDNKIKNDFDNYAHLYNENIFVYNVNIKDKIRLENIYKKHNIEYVINNIKFNCLFSDLDIAEILHGCVNIVNLNCIYKIKKYVYIMRTYTHKKLIFDPYKQANLLEENFIFNESVFLINENKGTLINIPDYTFGNKCYNSNNLFYKLSHIIKIQSPIYIPNCNVFCLCDNLLLIVIYDSLITDIDDKGINEQINKIISGPHSYIELFNFFKPTNKNRIIIGEIDKNLHCGMKEQYITESSVLGQFLHSLNLSV